MKSRDPLSDLLRTWTYEPPVVHDFNRSVWTRLRSAAPHEESPSRRAAIFSFPLMWSRSLAAGFAIALSAALGSAAAVAYDAATHQKKMAGLYARSIDPLQMSDSASPQHRHLR